MEYINKWNDKGRRNYIILLLLILLLQHIIIGKKILISHLGEGRVTVPAQDVQMIHDDTHLNRFRWTFHP